VRVRFIKDRGFRFEASDVEELINERTRVVCLSLVNFAHGFRAPIERIGRICRERGIWLVVDAVQALGVIPLDARSLGADIISAHAYKWLLGGFGLSLCYCSPRARRELRVPQIGWMGRREVTDLSALLRFDIDLTDEARRFEPSEPHLAGLYGLAASLDLLVSVGRDTIAVAVARLVEQTITGLQDRGYEVVSSQREGERSSIVSARPPGVESETIRAALERARVSCSIREGRIRVAPHFYNQPEDVARLLTCLPR
jgi:selenocysteine lyase/cysteine desulfurase